MRMLAWIGAFPGFVRHHEKAGFEICGLTPDPAHGVRMCRPFDDFCVQVVYMHGRLASRDATQRVQCNLPKFRASTILGVERKPNSAITLLFAPFEKVHGLHRRCLVGIDRRDDLSDLDGVVLAMNAQVLDFSNGMEDRGVVPVVKHPADFRK